MAIVVSKPVFQFDLEIPLSDFEAFNSEDFSHLSFMTLGFHTPSVKIGTIMLHLFLAHTLAGKEAKSTAPLPLESVGMKAP